MQEKFWYRCSKKNPAVNRYFQKKDIDILALCNPVRSPVRDILDARNTNVAAEIELVSDEKESYSRTMKLATLNEKINPLSKENEHLKGERESYQKSTQLLATETPNNIDKNVWNIVSNKGQRIRNSSLVNEINHPAITLNNVFEPLDADFLRERFE